MKLPLVALSSCLTTALAVAQVTGVPGINDYTIAPGCSGAMSCTSCCFLTPVPLVCNVSTAPGNAVIFFFSFCPCTTCFIPGPPNLCVPGIPSTACGSATNQAFEVVLGCVSSTSFTIANTTGLATFNLNIPNLGPAAPCSINLSTQAIIIDPCGLGVSGFPGPFVLSQAYSLNFW